MDIYSDDKFVSSNHKKPLWEDIKKFSKTKYVFAIALIILAVLGLVVPIIPGIIFIVLAIALFKKGWMSKIRTRFRLWKMK